MITFKQYLDEAIIRKWTTTDVDLTECINLLNSHCKDGLKAISNGGLLFRGFDGKDQPSNYHIIDTAGASRTSRDSNNLYQLVMDNSPALSAYSKRSESLICSTNINHAEQYNGYGNAMVVIPFDGTAITVSDSEDFLNSTYLSTRFGDYDLADLFYPLAKMLAGDLKIKPDAKNQYIDYQSLETKLSKVDALLLLYYLILNYHREMKINDKELDSFFNDSTYSKDKIVKFRKFFSKNDKCKDKNINEIYAILKNNPSNRLMALFANEFTPNKLELSLQKFGNSIDDKVESWFSGKAVLVNVETFASILRELNKAKFPIHKRYDFIMKYYK